MPEPTQTEREVKPIKPAVLETSAYDEILNQLPERVNMNKELKDRQSEIIKRLPSLDALTEQLYGHLRSLYLKSKGGGNETSDASLVAGELAEIITKAEYDHYPLILDGQEPIQPPEKTDQLVAEKLLGVLHNPDILIREFETKRNPDLAWLDIKNRVVRVIGEVKLTKSLNLRCFKQLRPDGFIANIKRTINFLNNHAKFGRSVFGTDENNQPLKGGVSDDVIEVVFMPRNTVITPDNWKNLIRASQNDKKEGLSSSQAEEFIGLLRDGKVKLAHFSFSRREISELTTAITARIKEKYGSN